VEWQRRLEEVRALTKWSRRLDRDDAPGPLSDDMRERLEALGYVH
jgi:hypothetical protein